MAIPFNDSILWTNYISNPDWHKDQIPSTSTPSVNRKEEVKRSLTELFLQTFKEPVLKSVQFIRDTARLVLKVPIRAIRTPIIFPKNWKAREHAKINATLTAYSFVQLLSVPAKFIVALTALATSAVSWKKAKYLLDTSENWSTHLNGRAAQLEALKEEGLKNASTQKEYNTYKEWIYSIDPKLCLKDNLKKVNSTPTPIIDDRENHLEEKKEALSKLKENQHVYNASSNSGKAISSSVLDLLQKKR